MFNKKIEWFCLLRWKLNDSILDFQLLDSTYLTAVYFSIAHTLMTVLI